MRVLHVVESGEQSREDVVCFDSEFLVWMHLHLGLTRLNNVELLLIQLWWWGTPSLQAGGG